MFFFPKGIERLLAGSPLSGCPGGNPEQTAVLPGCTQSSPESHQGDGTGAGEPYLWGSRAELRVLVLPPPLTRRGFAGSSTGLVWCRATSSVQFEPLEEQRSESCVWLPECTVGPLWYMDGEGWSISGLLGSSSRPELMHLEQNFSKGYLARSGHSLQIMRYGNYI